jgi:hypothetical protein
MPAEITNPRGTGRTDARTFSALNLLLGLWLAFSPFFFLGTGAEGTLLMNNLVIGLVIGLIALVRTIAPSRAAGLEWVNALLGAWLIVSPFFIAYTTGLFWSTIISGFLVMILAVSSAQATPPHMETTM